MSYEYSGNDAGLQAIAVFYLIFGVGCLIFFFGGICALLCCCNQRFRGIERKGYVIRDVEQNAPLMVPNVQPVPYPAGAPTAGWVAPSYPQAEPPPYGTAPAKY